MKSKTSQFIGVYKFRKKWVARIRKKKRQEYIGIFDDEKEAAKAYNRCAIYLYRDRAKLNAV